jgi:ribonucleoside-diphosphate reductase beta chain
LTHRVRGSGLAAHRPVVVRGLDGTRGDAPQVSLYGSPNPLGFIDLQDVQELSNSFERRVSAYQVGVTGEVSFEDDF